MEGFCHAALAPAVLLLLRLAALLLLGRRHLICHSSFAVRFTLREVPLVHLPIKDEPAVAAWLAVNKLALVERGVALQSSDSSSEVRDLLFLLGALPRCDLATILELFARDVDRAHHRRVRGVEGEVAVILQSTVCVECVDVSIDQLFEAEGTKLLPFINY